jgi:hypothetical protein
MKQRIYFPKNTRKFVIAEGYQSERMAQTAVDAFLQDVTYSEDCSLNYTRKRKRSGEKKKYTFSISIS